MLEACSWATFPSGRAGKEGNPGRVQVIRKELLHHAAPIERRKKSSPWGHSKYLCIQIAFSNFLFLLFEQNWSDWIRTRQFLGGWLWHQIKGVHNWKVLYKLYSYIGVLHIISDNLICLLGHNRPNNDS